MRRTNGLWLVLALLGLLMSLAACSPQGPALVVRDPWARPSPQMADTGVIYMDIVNRGNEEDALIGVQVDIAQMAEIHQSVMDENGVMKMQPVPEQRLPIPAKKKVSLAPQGYHIMLMGLKQPLEPGMVLQVTLRFEKSGEMTIEVPVRQGP